MSTVTILEKRLADSVTSAVTFAQMLPHQIRNRIAPHLASQARSEALRFARSLRPETCCGPSVVLELDALLAAVEGRIAEGTSMVPLETNDRLIVGREAPYLVKQYDTAAEALRKDRAMLLEMQRAVIQALDLSTAINVTKELLTN
ncbi:hypothetical protein [Thioclava sp. GXIMD4215]|uniref:hypothetical protein n=1 Tax=Thioclava sp. GXIMD4215 TaxID=3131928 RepID=UPI00311B2D57